MNDTKQYTRSMIGIAVYIYNMSLTTVHINFELVWYVCCCCRHRIEIIQPQPPEYTRTAHL